MAFFQNFLFLQKCSHLSTKTKPLELIAKVQHYEWGKFGKESLVAQLGKLNDEKLNINENKPFAELWMGDHINGPSKIKGTEQTLRDVLDQRLPFLFKVLSIRKALSIQVHPNKEDAEILHKLKPDIYKDPNHKPELAIALTNFKALCGFRPMEEIYFFCKAFETFEKFLGCDAIERLKSHKPDSLREVFGKMLCLKSDHVQACIEDVAKNGCELLEKHSILEVFESLKEPFPNDVGVLSIFFMNYLKLKPFEAIYIKPGQIHSYISGDCLECMASSDNVIRAGLTPKQKDIEQLMKSTNFCSQAPSEIYTLPYRVAQIYEVFVPPVKEFAVVRLQLSQTIERFEIPSCLSGSIFFITCGYGLLSNEISKGIYLSCGSVIYLPEREKPYILNKCTDDEFQAFFALQNKF